MTIQSPVVSEEPVPLQTYLANNNPASWVPTTIDQVFTKTLEQRRQAAQGPQFTQVLNGLSSTACEQMTQEFNALSSRVIAEWSLTQPKFKNEKEGKKLSSVYHRGPHGAEMGKDAELLLTKQAETIFTNEAQQKLFIKMAQVAHAIHDVIQDKGPPNNEIASAAAFTKACNEIIDKNEELSVQQKDELKKVAEHFGWETIVVGTTFDFKNKRPVVDILNEASRTYGNEAPKESDVAVACATFACGKNDTRRMEVNGDSYASDPELKRLQSLQAAATGGADNVFMQFMSTRPTAQDPKLMQAATHMIGQNCRMICELKTHMGKDEVDARFAEFLTNLINKASTTFDAEQHQEIKAEIAKINDQDMEQFFDKLIGSFKGAFGEVAFAKGLNSTTFDKAVNDFNALYPENRFELAGKGDLWQQYGGEAQAFIESIEAKISQIQSDPGKEPAQKLKEIKEYKTQVMADLALYGAHQMGAALIRENKDTLQAYDKVIQETRSKLQGMVLNTDLPTDNKGLEKYLDDVRSRRDNGSANKENEAPPVNQQQSRPRTVSFSTATKPEQKTEAIISLCEGLLNATREKERIHAQIKNLANSKHQELGPSQEEHPKVKRVLNA
jgi:hypothetical protein